MIVSSFAQQYGIRLNQEYETIKHLEFNQLLSGLNEETALGRTVQIRAEKDNKKIREMTNHEKKIRAEWQEFKRKQQKEHVVYLSKDEIDKVFSNMFR